MAKKKPNTGMERKKPKLPTVEVEGFGKLLYSRSGAFWAGVVALPTLAAKFPRYVSRGKDDAQLGWYRIPAGSYPVEVADERRQGPAPQQVAALQLLASKVARISREVIRCHVAASKEAHEGRDEYLESIGLNPSTFRLVPQPKIYNLSVLDLQFKGVAYVDIYFVDDEIDPEHGSHVVYHPHAGTHWTSNAFETITKGTQVYKASEPGLNDRLAEALYQGQWKKAEKMIAAGADINGFSRDAPSPLHVYAGNGKVDQVKRLLELGADPNKRGGETRSVLAEVREPLKDLRWYVRDAMRDAEPGARLEQLVPRSVLSEIAKFEEIVRLLEEAGAR